MSLDCYATCVEPFRLILALAGPTLWIPWSFGLPQGENLCECRLDPMQRCLHSAFALAPQDIAHVLKLGFSVRCPQNTLAPNTRPTCLDPQDFLCFYFTEACYPLFSPFSLFASIPLFLLASSTSSLGIPCSSKPSSSQPISQGPPIGPVRGKCHTFHPFSYIFCVYFICLYFYYNFYHIDPLLEVFRLWNHLSFLCMKLAISFVDTYACMCTILVENSYRMLQTIVCITLALECLWEVDLQVLLTTNLVIQPF